MAKRTSPSLASRLLATVVGMGFLFSVAMAQMPLCQCGILCLHEPLPPPEPTVIHGCCPSEPDPSPSVPESPCQDEEGGCTCPLQISVLDDQAPFGPVPAVVTSVDVRAEVASLAATNPFDSLTSPIDASPTTCPTRGSPKSPVPIQVLHSVFLI